MTTGVVGAGSGLARKASALAIRASTRFIVSLVISASYPAFFERETEAAVSLKELDYSRHQAAVSLLDGVLLYSVLQGLSEPDGMVRAHAGSFLDHVASSGRRPQNYIPI